MAKQTSDSEMAGGATRPPVAVNVERVQLTARAGATVVTRVHVTNKGEAPIALQQADKVPLRKADALARGVRAAFKGQTGDVVARLIALGRHLQEEPSPTAKIRYKAPFASLPPGQSAEIEIELGLPASLSSETGWVARLPIMGTTVSVEIEIAKGAAGPERPGKKSARKTAKKRPTRRGDEA